MKTSLHDFLFTLAAISLSFERCEKQEEKQRSVIGTVHGPLLCSQIQNTCTNLLPEKM